MVAAGVIPESERIEMIDGEVVAMSAKGRRHEIVRNELALAWSRRLPPELKLATETPLWLDPETAPEPDIIVFPAPLLAPDVNGDSVLLVIEISDSSVSYDLKVKSVVYAAFGVREYWVIDARSLVTTVHRGLNDQGYAEIREIPGVDTITPSASPALATRLADLIGDKLQP
jgi:Uma2 family endonuclease